MIDWRENGSLFDDFGDMILIPADRQSAAHELVKLFVKKLVDPITEDNPDPKLIKQRVYMCYAGVIEILSKF